MSSSSEESGFDRLIPDEPTRLAARGAVRDVLEMGGDMFRRLLVPESIKSSDLASKLFNQFDNTTLNALVTLFFDLDRALFKSPESVFFREGTETRELIQYVPHKQTTEFAEFIRSVMNSEPFPGKVVLTDFLREWVKNLRLAITPPIEADWQNVLHLANTPSETAALNRWREQVEEIENRFDESLRAGLAVDVATEAAAEVTRLRDVTRRATGQVGAYSLGVYFSDLGSRESSTAFKWTIAAFFGAAAVLGIGGWVVYRSSYTQWQDTLIHLAVALPIVGAAAYASRIARHHRLLSRWAKTASVQVNSVEAFSQQLSNDAERDKLILELGRNVFATPNYEDSQGEHFSVIPSDVLDAAMKQIVRK